MKSRDREDTPGRQSPSLPLSMPQKAALIGVAMNATRRINQLTAALLFVMAAIASVPAGACDCSDQDCDAQVLNGRIDTADLSGGVGAGQFVDDCCGGGGVFVFSAGASAGAAASASAFAFARAHAFAGARAHAFAHAGMVHSHH